jgi:NAD(P)-dependent dehydrogenase (short-subunit alcohol dehydrogenase family)
MVRLKPVSQQVVVLMGASSGIGRDTAIRFAKKGARLVLSSRSADELEELAGELRGLGAEAIAVPADTTDFEQVKAVAARAVEAFGGFDTWVQVAGVGLWALFEQTTPDEWRQIIDVNLNGQALGAMAALPHLKERGGALIFVSSVEARLAAPYQAAYAASKHGVHALAKVVRLEMMHEKAPVSVTEIMPASTNTPLFDQARSKLGAAPQPPPPIYEVGVVGEAIVYAAEHPLREMVLGGVTRVGMIAQSILPAAMDAYFLALGFRLQKRDKPAGPNQGEGNLFQAGDRDGATQGTLPARSFSTGAWLERHPVTKGLLATALVGGAFLLGASALKKMDRS